MAQMLGYRVRYFTADTVIDSKAFVNEAFAAAGERFSAKSKDGARAMKRAAAATKNGIQSRNVAQMTLGRHFFGQNSYDTCWIFPNLIQV